MPKDRLDGLHCVQCGGFWKDAPLGNNDLEMGELDAVNTELQNALTLAMRKHVLEHMNGYDSRLAIDTTSVAAFTLTTTVLTLPDCQTNHLCAQMDGVR